MSVQFDVVTICPITQMNNADKIDNIVPIIDTIDDRLNFQIRGVNYGRFI